MTTHDYLQKSNQLDQAFTTVLTEKAGLSYKPEFLSRMEPQEAQAQALGLLTARLIGYDGEEIAKFLLTALAAGLEDANWHTEATKVVKLLEAMSNGKFIDELL